jgi:PAS domain S-box-containing protein
MSLLLIVSIVIRLAAIVWAMIWSVVVLRRLRDWRMGLLTGLLALMTLRESLTFLGNRDFGIISVISGAAEQPGIVLSIALLIAVPFLGRMLIDRKKVEDALRQSEAKFRVLAETARSGILISQGSRLVYLNPFAEALVGYSKEELVSMDALELVHPDFREFVRSRRQARLEGDGSPSRYEFKMLAKNGEEMWLDFAASPIEFEGKPALLATAFDVTERKTAEAALNASEERYRRIVETAQEGIWMVDAEANTTYVNQHLAEMFGGTRDEMLGRSVFDFVDAAAHRETRRLLERGRQGIKGHHEFRFLRKDGSDLWTIVSTTPLFDGEGRFAGGLAMLVDVTEHHLAEAALRASEERYRDLVENARDIIYSHDLKGNYTSVNKAVEQITGYSREEVLNLNFEQTVSPEYLEMGRQMIAAKLAGQKETVYDLEIIAKDGRRIAVEASTRLVLQDNVPIGIQGIARDVTERKRAEEALRHIEERFRRYFELGLIGMAIASPAKGFIEVNDKMCEILGYERAELPQLTWAELTHPDDLAANIANFDRVLAAESDGYSMDKRFIRKDGRVIHATISVSCVRRADRSVDYFIALLEDVTERKRAEQALRESRSHLQAILDNCPAMIFQKDLEGRYLQVNLQFERTFNLLTEQVLGRTDDELFPPELAAAFRASDRGVFEAGRSLEFEESALVDDGLHTYIVHKFPLRDAAGNVYAVGGVSTDITARKRAEDDLRKQKEILQKIFDHIPVMIRFLDEYGRVKLINREWERTLGWSLEEIEGRGLDIFAELYPDPEYCQQVLTFIAASTGEFTDLRTRARDGRVIDTSFANVRLEDGTNIGIGRDITESKRAEERLRRQAAQLAALREIELEISAESTLSRVLEVVTHRAAELLNAYHCSVYIRDRERADLNLVASLDSEMIGLRLKEGEGLAGRVALLGHAQAIDDYMNWEGRALVFEPKRFGPALSAPLKWQQIVTGAISLVRKQGEEPFSFEDSHFLEQIAADAAIAIHQATLFEEVQEGHKRLQVLSHRLIDAHEAERKRLARELHDQIGQALTAVQISLQTLQSSTHDSSAKLLDDSLAIIDEAIEQVHDLSLDLRPSLLDDLGLVAALRWYVGRVASRAGLVHEFKADDLDTRLAPEVETACFRIAQEALTNVLRHASATNVSVEITCANSDLRLFVRDNGVGFDARTAMSRTGLSASLGFQGMQERAAAVGGSVDIKSKLRRGTEVQATFLL